MLWRVYEAELEASPARDCWMAGGGSRSIRFHANGAHHMVEEVPLQALGSLTPQSMCPARHSVCGHNCRGTVTSLSFVSLLCMSLQGSPMAKARADSQLSTLQQLVPGQPQPVPLTGGAAITSGLSMPAETQAGMAGMSKADSSWGWPSARRASCSRCSLGMCAMFHLPEARSSLKASHSCMSTRMRGGAARKGYRAAVEPITVTHGRAGCEQGL